MQKGWHSQSAHANTTLQPYGFWNNADCGRIFFGNWQANSATPTQDKPLQAKVAKSPIVSAGTETRPVSFSVTHTFSSSHPIASSFRNILLGLIFCMTLTSADNLSNEITFPQLLEPGQSIFNYHGVDFNVIATDTDLIVYSSFKEDTRQIYTLSKTLDYTEIAIANRNLRLTLDTVVKGNYWSQVDNFRMIRDKEIHSSSYKMTYSSCQLYCARFDAAPISHVDQFYDIVNSFDPDHVWIDACTQTKTVDDTVKYTVSLGKVELFPKNGLGMSTPKIFHYIDNKKTEITDIKTLYNYYDSQREKYWTEHHYKLNTVLSRDGDVFVYIPQDARFLTSSDYHAYCGCVRGTSHTTKIYNDLYKDFQTLRHQQNEMNIGIETLRLSSTNNAGSLVELIKPYLSSNMPSNFTNKYVELKNVAPLLNTSVSHQDLMHTLVVIGAKKIGASVAMSLLGTTLKQVKKSYGARILHNTWKDKPLQANYFDLSNLHLEKTNFSLIVKFPEHHLDSFAYNTSNNLHLADTLVKNLTISNKELQSLLHNHVQDLLLNMAADDLIHPVDFDAPVLAVVKPGKSYIYIQFFITTICKDNLITHYKSNGLPKQYDGQKYFALDVPKTFSASVDASSSFRFTDENTQARESCVHAFLGMDFSALSTQCQSTEFSNKKLITLQHLDSFRLIYARGQSETLKILCTRSSPLYHAMTHDVLIFIAPTDCEISLISTNGIFTIQRNLSDNQNLIPRFLFHYNLSQNASTNFYQWLTITILASVTGLLIIILATIATLVYKNRLTTEIELQEDSMKNIPEMILDNEKSLKETPC